MREVLFRGKRKDNGEWVYGWLGHLHCHNPRAKTIDSIYFTEITEDHDSTMNIIVDYETVGQYTGLTDKNGKKIFEGDVLQTGTRMGYILFEKGCFKFRWKNFDKYREDFFKTCILTEYGSFKELEVIGNIHDNSELLKGGAE
jgi:uncharacterized phage protein (TIGR01671 family)